MRLGGSTGKLTTTRARNARGVERTVVGGAVAYDAAWCALCPAKRTGAQADAWLRAHLHYEHGRTLVSRAERRGKDLRLTATYDGVRWANDAGGRGA